MKHGIGLSGIGHNVHSCPITGEAIMGCGLQFTTARWKQLDDKIAKEDGVSMYVPSSAGIVSD